MASNGAKPKLEELLAGIPDASLDGRIGNAHLETIARSLKSWKEVTPYLGLTEAEEEDIINDNRRHRNQKSAALRKWKKKAGAHATYRKLASAFHECGLADTIDAIRDVINAPTPAFPPTNTYSYRLQGTRWLWIMGALIVLVISIAIVVYPLLFANCQPTSLTLKAPIENFVGRNSEMEEIIKRLQDFSVVNIVGPPGFGKSALAISVGHQLRSKGNTIIYVDMSEVADSQDLKHWILNGAGVAIASNDAMVDQKLQIWASKLECPIVIILDGCDEMIYKSKDDLSKVIQKFRTSTHHIRILTTSRHSLVIPNAHGIDMKELSLQNAYVLLGKIHSPLNHTQKQLVVNATGGVPLALVIVGALLNRAYAPTPDVVISDLQDLLKTLSPSDFSYRAPT